MISRGKSFFRRQSESGRQVNLQPRVFGRAYLAARIWPRVLAARIWPRIWHQHGVSIQMSTNLDDTLLRIARELKTADLILSVFGRAYLAAYLAALI